MALRILSIDGGGIRGIIPAYWLTQLESRLGKSVHSRFDMFAGTSTGAIIAAGLASGLPAKQIFDLYRMSSPQIFQRRTIRLERLAAILEFIFFDDNFKDVAFQDVLLRLQHRSLPNSFSAPSH